MDKPIDDVFRRIEASIEQMSAQISDAGRTLASVPSGEDQSPPPPSPPFNPEALTRELGALREAVQACEAQVVSSLARVDALERSVSELQTAPERGATEWSGAADIRREMDNLQDETRRLRGEVAALRALSGKLDDLRALLGSPQGGDADLDEVLYASPASGSVADAERVLNAAQDEHVQTRQEIADLRADVEALRAGANEAEQPLPEGLLQATDANGTRRAIGEILVHADLITLEQLDIALSEQQGHDTPHKRLGAILVEKGFATDIQVAQVLACQLGIPFVDIDEEEVDERAVRLIGSRLAHRHQCPPLHITEEGLVLAMANPLDLVAIDDVRITSGLEVYPSVACESGVAEAVTQWYGEE